MIDSVEVRVKGGFPLTVLYTIHPAEPDVGIDRDYFEIDGFETPTGGDASWIEKGLSGADWDAINEAIFDHEAYYRY